MTGPEILEVFRESQTLGEREYLGPGYSYFINHAWLKAKQRKNKKNAVRMRRMRAQFRAQGLTASGHVPKRPLKSKKRKGWLLRPR